MKLSVTQRYRFSASHRLHVLSFSDDKNARLYGKCNNPYGHGHDYVLSVTAEGHAENSTGLLVSRQQLDSLVNGKVLSIFRHKYLNVDLAEFTRLVPTTENVALVIASLLAENWPDYIGNQRARLARVHVQETDRNGFEIVIPAHSEKEGSHIHESVIVHG